MNIDVEFTDLIIGLCNFITDEIFIVVHANWLYQR
jgi:hypothetical protein